MSDSLVIIPTFNEKENIERIIRKVFSLKKEFHILVVDDGSPDGTAEIVKSLQQEYPASLFIMQRSGKSGLGTAYIHGFNWALERSYQYIFEMDADFSHNPDDLLRLYHACFHQNDPLNAAGLTVQNPESGAFRPADLSIGSRYISGVNVVNWPMARVLLSYFASLYVRYVTGIPVKDSTAGFKCYRRKVLEAIDLRKIKFTGYAFQIEMKFRAWKLGFNIVEVPIIFTNRKEGVSKMSTGIFKEAFFGVLQMKWDSLFGKI